jgi:hypothetical protein
MKNLHYTPDGVVKKIEGDAQSVLEDIVKRLSILSEFAVKSALDTVVQSHTDTNPVPADISHLPSPHEKILNTIPSASKT